MNSTHGQDERFQSWDGLLEPLPPSRSPYYSAYNRLVRGHISDLGSIDSEAHFSEDDIHIRKDRDRHNLIRAYLVVETRKDVELSKHRSGVAVMKCQENICKKLVSTAKAASISCSSCF